jgi:hypothetical protein
MIENTFLVHHSIHTGDMAQTPIFLSFCLFALDKTGVSVVFLAFLVANFMLLKERVSRLDQYSDSGSQPCCLRGKSCRTGEWLA